MRKKAGKREHGFDFKGEACRGSFRLACCLAVLGVLILTGCGGSGGGHDTSRAASEQDEAIALSLPALITYRDASGSTVTKTVALEFSFRDDDLTATTVMRERNPESEALAPILTRAVVMDYAGRMLSDHIDASASGGGVTHAAYERATAADGTAIVRRYLVDAAGGRTLVDTRTTAHASDGGTEWEQLHVGDIGGALVEKIIRTYAAGKLTSEIIDADADDATPAETHGYGYDGQGRLDTLITDADSDGTPETKDTYGYNAAGLMETYARYSYDDAAQAWPADDEWSSSWSYTYDDQGLLAEIRRNEDRDATIDEYMGVAWRSYTAPAGAAALKGLDFEALMRFFAVTEE